MYRLILLVMALLVSVQARAEEPSQSFSEADRILVIAPHPDDETLGMGGMLQRARASGAKVRVVYLTNGESNEVASIFYQKRPLLLRSDFVKSGLARKQEALDAMGSIGLAKEDLAFFGYPDGGMLTMWLRHWEGSRPFRSLFTAGRAFKGDEVVRDLERAILSFQPTAVYVTAPFDLNTDHQAAYLYLQVALLNLAEQLTPAPSVRVYLVHAHRWPDPKKYLPREPLPIPAHIDWAGQVDWEKQPLTPEEVQKKHDMLMKYKSQIAYKKQFLLAFARSNEIFAQYAPEKIKREAVPDDALLPAASTATADVRYSVRGSDLWVEIPMTSMVDEMGALSAYVFGYRKGHLFSSMPKLAFKLFGNKMFVYDGLKNFHDPKLVYRIDRERVFIRIPLRILKHPEVIFVSTRNAKEQMSLDFGAWRVLEVAPEYLL